jgi:hypothetical protein
MTDRVEKPRKVTLDEARAARRPVGAVKKEAEDAETLAQAQILEAQRKAQELAEANPIRQECAALGEELKKMGVPWHFGDTISTDFHTAVLAKAAMQLLIEEKSLPVPLERAQDVIFSILRTDMQAALAAAKAQRAQPQLYVPDAPGVPPDLLPFKGKSPSD